MIKKIIKYIEQESKSTKNPLISKQKIGQKDFIYYNDLQKDFDDRKSKFTKYYEDFRQLFTKTDRMTYDELITQIPE